MIETFLCFESGGASFLIPLNQVRHIIPGNAGKGKPDESVEQETELIDMGRFWGGACVREFAILLESDQDQAAVLADRVDGVFEIPPDCIYPLPEEAVGERNDFLIQAAYLKDCGSWAFVINIEQFLNRERN